MQTLRNLGAISTLLAAILVLISGDLHRFGDTCPGRFGETNWGSQLILSKQLFTDTSAVARNYTVVFKLLDQLPHASVSCVQLHVAGDVCELCDAILTTACI